MTKSVQRALLPAAVIRMLELGVSIFPVKWKNKTPLIKDWPREATKDLTKIEAWKLQFGNCNWGIATGPKSGAFVVDVDGDEGKQTLQHWQSDHGDDWCKTLTVNTGKGLHLYFQSSDGDGIRNSVKCVSPGIDIRGLGGYVVAPGSIHPFGHEYKVIQDLPIVGAADWLLRLLSKRTRQPEETVQSAVSVGSVTSIVSATVNEGGRNAFLTMQAGAMRRRGSGLDTIEAALLKENLSRNSPPLGDEEVRAIARSICRYQPDYEVSSTEIGLKEGFIAEYGNDIRIVDGKEWRIWEQIGKGGRWKKDVTRQVEDRIQRFLSVQAGLAPNESEASSIASSYRVLNLLRLAGSDRNIAVMRERFDSDPMVLNTPSGLICFESGLCRETAREDYCSKITTIGPEEMATPYWDSYLMRFHPDKERQLFLQRWFGYCLTGDTREQTLIFGHGPAKNGKSTCLNVISWIMGDYATTPSMDAFIFDDHHNRHPTDLAALVGSRLAVAAETQEGRWWDEVKIKQCTGGDRISVRFMRQDFFTYTPQFKLFFVGNHRPRIRTVDDAMRRRFLIVPFDVTLRDEERIMGFDELLKKEGQGILAWMIAGTHAWLKGTLVKSPGREGKVVQMHPPGLNPPESVRSASREYMESEDTTGQWSEECVELRQDAWTGSGALYESYETWCRNNGMSKWSRKRFSSWLSEQPGLSSMKKSGVRGYQGISLRVIGIGRIGRISRFGFSESLPNRETGEKRSIRPQPIQGQQLNR